MENIVWMAGSPNKVTGVSASYKQKNIITSLGNSIFRRKVGLAQPFTPYPVMCFFKPPIPELGASSTSNWPGRMTSQKIKMLNWKGELG